METRLIMEDGKIIEKEAIRAIQSLKNGEYICLCIPIIPKSVKDHQRLFFYKLRTVCRITGDNVSELYQLFKIDNDIPTTSKLNIEEWEVIHVIFQSWIYNNLDIII